MVEANSPQETAQTGLRQIEEAILRLLDANPQGLRNVDIARTLGLRSDFPGRRRDYLTYSVLGGLFARGEVLWDQQSKLFTSKNANVSPLEQAQAGLESVEDAILLLLQYHPAGLRNAEIADSLNLRSDFRGRQRDYLTYSVLGGLVSRGKLNWDSQTKLFTVSRNTTVKNQEL